MRFELTLQCWQQTGKADRDNPCATCHLAVVAAWRDEMLSCFRQSTLIAVLANVGVIPSGESGGTWVFYNSVEEVSTGLQVDDPLSFAYFGHLFILFCFHIPCREPLPRAWILCFSLYVGSHILPSGVVHTGFVSVACVYLSRI